MTITRICGFFCAVGLLCMVAVSAVHAQVYTQNFDGFADGTTNLGDGTAIFGTNLGAANGAGVQSGALQLTNDGVGSGYGIFQIPALTGSSLGWTATFDATLIDSAGNNNPADGFSFNYGNIPQSDNGYQSYEEGWGSGTPYLSVEFDTWQVGDTEHGFNVGVNGTDVPGGFINFDLITDGQTVSAPVEISYDPDNGVSLTVDNTPVFTDLATPGFTGDDNFTFNFGARTGGATETLLIDNLNITTAAVPEPASVAIWTLIGLAGAGFGLFRWRRKK